MNKNIPETELLYTNSIPVDKLSTSEALQLMLTEHENGIFSVQKSIKEIEKVVNAIFDFVKSNQNSKIIYCGAGTSGRIGVQDGVELNPIKNYPYPLRLIIRSSPSSFTAKLYKPIY